MTEKNHIENIELFFSGYQPFSFKSGEVLLSAGEYAHFLYYLKSGVIKQSATSTSGHDVTITLYKQGSFFPLIWTVKDTALLYDFVALTDGEGWRAPKEEVINVLKHNPEITFDVTKRLLSGLEGLSRKLEFALQANALLRVSEALLSLAYRFGKKDDAGTTIDLVLTHQELAKITGLSRETVTRELQTLKENKIIITLEKMYVIPDIDMLEKSTHSLER